MVRLTKPRNKKSQKQELQLQLQQEDVPPSRKRRWSSGLLLTVFGSFIAGRTTLQVDWSTNEQFLTSMVKAAMIDDNFNFTAAAIMPSSSRQVLPDVSFKENQKEDSDMMYPPYLHHHHMLQDAPLFINDRTMRLSPYVDRLWLHNTDLSATQHTSSDQQQQQPATPKTKIILTDFGWNQPNQTEALKCTRTIRQRELLQAIIDHPLFDPTFSWNETMTTAAATNFQFDPSIQYFVFLDLETCFESNYPHYAAGKEVNLDIAANRSVYANNWDNICFGIYQCKPVLQKVLQSPLFQQMPTARLFYFDCRGLGPDGTFRKDGSTSPQLSIVSISSGPGQLLVNASDMGQPPPAVNPIRLTRSQRTAIRTTCENDRDDATATGGDNNNNDASLINDNAITKTKLRPYFLSFVGSPRTTKTRESLFRLHNLEQGIILLTTLQFQEEFRLHHPNITDRKVMQGSIFAATPRGDQLFSYRFTEALSAGAIPVVHADGWVLPFARQLIDWKECAVIIPESQVHETIDILKRIDPATRCRMRRRCYDIYTKYMANPEGTIAGILETASLKIAATTN